MNFKDDVRWLADKFERDYVRNWEQPPGYADVLAAAPSVSIPDDHEYWNNFPHASAIVQNSWGRNGRARWTAAAHVLYDGFQLASAAPEPTILDVPPLSFCLVDTRRSRAESRRSMLPPGVLQAIGAWRDRVLTDRLIGVFATGQSLFEDAKGGISGKIVDYALADYDDYPALMQTLATFGEQGRPLLCVTGDVHWGRVAVARHRRRQRDAVYEIVSSPSSLVTTQGGDTFKEIAAFLGGLVGRRNPWPRHSDPDAPPAFLASSVLGRALECRMVHPQKGNHVCLLSFRRDGAGLALRVTYWPIDARGEVTAPVQLTEIKIPPSWGG
ncbi:hypothetical protein [Candidatus Nitrospira bockiana]